jgi:excinuclease UvrABC nuclease subunit
MALKNGNTENMDFEKAISYRDKTRDLEKLKQSQVSELGKNIDEDIFVFNLEKL